MLHNLCYKNILQDFLNFLPPDIHNVFAVPNKARVAQYQEILEPKI